MRHWRVTVDFTVLFGAKRKKAEHCPPRDSGDRYVLGHHVFHDFAFQVDLPELLAAAEYGFVPERRQPELPRVFVPALEAYMQQAAAVGESRRKGNIPAEKLKGDFIVPLGYHGAAGQGNAAYDFFRYAGLAPAGAEPVAGIHRADTGLGLRMNKNIAVFVNEN
jgi:hypothetical protein